MPTNSGRFLDPKTEQFELNLFYALASLGDVFSLYIAELIMDVLGLDWAAFIICFSLLLAASALLANKYVEDYPIEYEPTRSLTEFVRDKCENMKLVLHHSRRAAAVLENVLLIGFYYNVLTWYPYYFADIGYGPYATNLSVITPLLVFCGCLAFESLTKFCLGCLH